MRPYLKETPSQKTGLVEWLKMKALSLSLSIAKTKQNKTKQNKTKQNT
jgi:hypothetical protein